MADIGIPVAQKPLKLPTGSKTQLSTDDVARAQNRVLDANGNVWMGPGTAPVPSGAPDESPRRTDYPIAWNVYRNPSTAKSVDGGIDFAILREFAKQALVRTAIETCKDLDEETEYVFTLRADPNEKPGATRKRADTDPRVQEVTDFFDSPDGIHDFVHWRRLMWEEMLVADNLSLYRMEYAFGGKSRKLRGIRVIDGDTIEPLIDINGYEPTFPDPAYDQWIKGYPRTQFTNKELLYAVLNPRVKYVFGHSPTEQSLAVINIMIRRDFKKLAEYTDGNIPAGIWSAPKDWTPTHIQDAQLWLDSYMSGDPAARSKLVFVPGGDRPPVFPAEHSQHDTFDDMLTRLICSAFNVSVTSLLPNQNRSTSQTSKEQAEEEGVVIRRKKMTRLLNRIIRWAFGYTDVIALARQNLETDPVKQSTIDFQKLQTGVAQINELRERDGEEPIPDLVDVYGFFSVQNGFATFDASIRTSNAAADLAENPPPPPPVIGPAGPGGAVVVPPRAAQPKDGKDGPAKPTKGAAPFKKKSSRMTY